MDTVNEVALLTIGITPADTVYILTHSEQADALRIAKESYLAALQAIANKVLPRP